jgi:hypothetical protein
MKIVYTKIWIFSDDSLIIVIFDIHIY